MYTHSSLLETVEEMLALSIRPMIMLRKREPVRVVTLEEHFVVRRFGIAAGHQNSLKAEMTRAPSEGR